MLYRSRVAFREPSGDGFVEAVAPDQDVEVPDELAPTLLAAGHIAIALAPAPAPVAAPVTHGMLEGLHERLLRVEEHLGLREPAPEPVPAALEPAPASAPEPEHAAADEPHSEAEPAA